MLDDVTDRDIRSVELWHRLAQLDVYAEARVVMAFAALPGEPDTDALFRRLADVGKQLVLPRIDGDLLVPVRAGGTWSSGTWGIREPVGPAVDVTDIDLVIVPGLAFTVDGHRLGRGKGFYDRFLAAVDAPTIGVCFSEQIVDELPVEGFDICVDRVVMC